MKNWKTSLYVQIAYMAGMGLGLLFTPALLTSIFHLGPAEEVWVRVTGLLALVLCGYYYAAIKNEALWFARASVWVRYGFCASLAALALLFGVPMLIAFAVLEAGLAVWTHTTLNQYQNSQN